jgi:hypothetical protein
MSSSCVVRAKRSSNSKEERCSMPFAVVVLAVLRRGLRVEWRQGPPLEPHGQTRVQTAAVQHTTLSLLCPSIFANPDAQHAVSERVLFLIVERLFSSAREELSIVREPQRSSCCSHA